MVLHRDGVEEFQVLNGIKGMRAAMIYNTYGARLTMEHNDAQVIILAWGVVGPSLIA